MKDTKRKKRLPPPLAFLEQVHVQRGNLFEKFLHPRKGAQTLFHLWFQFGRNGDLAHTPIPQTDGENPDGPVALPGSFFAIPATGLIAAHHAAEQRSRQDRAGLGQLGHQSSASGGKFGRFIFHRHLLKDKPCGGGTQEKTTETSQIVCTGCQQLPAGLHGSPSLAPTARGRLARPAYPRLASIALAGKTSGIGLQPGFSPRGASPRRIVTLMKVKWPSPAASPSSPSPSWRSPPKSARRIAISKAAQSSSSRWPFTGPTAPIASSPSTAAS